MSKYFWIAIIVLDILFFLLVVERPDIIVGGIAHAQNSESANCPASTAEGKYFIQGYDNNGNAICGFSYYNPCPYADAESADSPVCQKLSLPIQRPTMQEIVPTFQGK